MPAASKSALKRNLERNKGTSEGARELRIEYMALDSLAKWPRNPKNHILEKIGASMQRFGYNDPIAIDENSQRVVEGHGRIDALQQQKTLGHEPPRRVVVKGKEWFVPVLRGINFENVKEAEAYLLAHNQQVIAGGFQEETLGGIFKEIGKELFDLTGFDDKLYTSAQDFLSNGKQQEQPVDDESAEPEDRFLVFKETDVLEEAFKWYRASGFPYPKLTLHEQMQEINKLASLDQDAALTTNVAHRVADCYHPQRFACHATNKIAPVESFKDDKRLRKALELELKYGAVRTGYVSLIDLVLGTQACGNFRPGIAMHIYRLFGQEGGLILDPCAGFGGRLIGWIASRLGGRYVGIDPNTATQQNNKKMAEALGAQARYIVQPFEDVDLKKEKLLGACDLVFTSPPYFNKELYSEEATQSCKRYPNFKDWTNGFLKPFFEQCYKALKPGGICAVNIADVTQGKKVFPIEIMTLQLAEAAGFKSLETLTATIGANRFSKGENIGSLIGEEEAAQKQVEQIFVFHR